MPPPVRRACLAVWAERVSTMKPRDPWGAPSSTARSTSSSSAQRRFWGPVKGWLERSSTCGRGSQFWKPYPPALVQGPRSGLAAHTGADRGRLGPRQNSDRCLGGLVAGGGNDLKSRLWAGPGLTKKGLGICGADPPATEPGSLDSENRGGAGLALETAGFSGVGEARPKQDPAQPEGPERWQQLGSELAQPRQKKAQKGHCWF